MNNEPVAWMNEHGEISQEEHWAYPTPLYTHPAKKKYLSLQKIDGELVAVTYTDYEHRIIEVLWEKPPAKTLTDEEILKEWTWKYSDCFEDFLLQFARAILRKAQENG